MKDAVAALNSLLMHAFDMVRAYTAALDRLRDEELREPLLAFRLDHERNLSDLTALVLRLGGVPKGRRDALGPLREGFTAFSAIFGDGAALKALQRAEEAGLRAYAEARQLGLGEVVDPVLAGGLSDHGRHLGWLGPAIREQQELGGGDEARL